MQVNVTDYLGNRVIAEHIKMIRDGVAEEVPQDTTIRSKCGPTTLTVTVPGFKSETMAVELGQTEQIVAVAMRLGTLDDSGFSCDVLGAVKASAGIVRIRLIQLFGAYSIDVPVRKATAFEVRNIECGTYLLVAMGANNCLGTVVLRITAETGRVARIVLGEPISHVKNCNTINWQSPVDVIPVR